MSVRVPRFALVVAVLCFAGLAGAQVPSPTIEGPITSPDGVFLPSTTFDLASVGYEQDEYFISGTATAYTTSAPLGTDGMWSVTPSGTTAAYKTRILVYRPTDPKKFSGTVVVEWLNVSGGVDANPDWTQGHVELIREGVAWVGVSAQYVGVEGGTALVGIGISLPLKSFRRYKSLHHPGDSFSYDMFSQAGQAVRSPSGPNPLGTLKPKRVIAIGESQSAFRLVNYVDGIHPITHLYDGYFIHSRGGFDITPLSESPQPAIGAPGTAEIRADIDVPVLTFEIETDVTFLNYFPATQNDAKHFRLWEVAGTAHYDTYGLGVGATDVGTSRAVAAPLLETSVEGGLIKCVAPINSGPQHYVVDAALSALFRWVRTGKAPHSAPRLDASAGPPIALNRDARGNALGGIRTPEVDVPIGTFTGEQTGTLICEIFGTTTLFDDATLKSLYPTHKAFTKAYARSLKRATKKGWLVKPDAKLIQEWAESATIGD
jgi:hypothetical protein